MVGAALALALGAGAWWYARGRSGPGRALIPGEAGPALTVEVLNATDVDGLARAVARRLRRHGIDVVDFGSAPRPAIVATRIVVRRGDSLTAVPVRRALGVGTISVELDPRRLLDVTVLVGRDLVVAGADGNP